MLRAIVVGALIAIFLPGAVYAQFGSTTQTGQTQGGTTSGVGSGLSFGSGSMTPLDASFGATTFGSASFGTGANNLLGAAAISQASRLGGGFGTFGGGLGGLGGFGGAGRGLGGQNFNNANSQNDRKIRATVKLGFTQISPSPAMVTTQVNGRLLRTPLPAKFSSVRVEMVGRTAKILGSVPTEEDGKLMERLLSLEPGIDGVDNQLTYSAEPAANQPATQASEIVPAPAPQ